MPLGITLEIQYYHASTDCYDIWKSVDIRLLIINDEDRVYSHHGINDPLRRTEELRTAVPYLRQGSRLPARRVQRQTFAVMSGGR